MTPGDYSSDQFKRRALRLIQRLGTVWDNDPRVAYIELGLIGRWGEQHSPSITPEMQGHRSLQLSGQDHARRAV